MEVPEGVSSILNMQGHEGIDQERFGRVFYFLLMGDMLPKKLLL